MRFRIAAFVCALILGFLTWASYKMGMNRIEEKKEELYPSPTAPSTFFLHAVYLGLFAIGLFLYSIGLWNIICDALYKWLAP